ncbi:MAG: acylneuraminate cytidylyltransferase family protein [Synergistaceae bacterium]
MKVVALVPIKMNNTRLPGKNTMLLKNKPLISYILDTLLQSKYIDDIYVYCSNEEIKKYIPNNIIYLKRDIKLDKDSTKINDVIKSFVSDVCADVYLLAHATAPFIKIENIDKGLRAILTGNYDSSLAVKKLQSFMWNKNMPNYDLDDIPRTQDMEPIFIETCGFYAFLDSVIKKGRRIGEKPYFVEVGDIESIDIDNKDDFEFASLILEGVLK